MFLGWNLVWVILIGCIFLYFGPVRLRRRRNQVRRDVLGFLSRKTMRTTRAELVSAVRNRHKHPTALIEEAIRDLVNQGKILKVSFSEGSRRYTNYVVVQRDSSEEGRSP